jgi:hypothetical protein
MTFRIDRAVEDDLEVFYVSGRIEPEDLDVLRATLGRDTGALAIDLRDIGLINGETVKFLAIIEANGGTLRNCPAFIREWINRERSQEKSTESEKASTSTGVEES